MLYVHRWTSILAGLLIVYICVTGLWITTMDLAVNFTHQPTSNPTMQEFRQHINGPDSFAVISDPDYDASALPADLDKSAALMRLAASARAAAPSEPMKLIELRMSGDRVAGQVKMGKTRLLYDALTGERLPDAQLPPANPNAITHGLRADMKSWHKFAFNKWLLQKAAILNFLAGIAIFCLMVTGLTHYLRMLKMRRGAGKTEVFWSGGGFWRKFHRWTALASVLLVTYLTVTGMLMAVSDMGAAYAEWKSPRDSRPVHPDKGDFSSPIKDTEIQSMATATAAAFERDHPNTPIKVFRLRYYAGYAQGAIVTGEDKPRQHVYDTKNGRVMTATEPGYPISNFPFGWETHQTIKRFHRGDIVGLGGNTLEWIAGVALLYLVCSGLWMYFDLWRKRAKTGKRQIVWR